MVKKILLGLLVVVMLSLVGIGVYVWQFDIDDYRTDLENQLQQATGFDVQIVGGLGMQTSPDLQLVANDVRFAMQDREYLDLNNVTVTVAWKPFLQRELQVMSVEMANATVSLWQDAEGNWLFPEPEKATEPESPPPAAAAALPLKRAILDRFAIDNLQVAMHRLGDTPERLLSLSDVEFELHNLLLADDAQLLIDQWPEYLERVPLKSTLNIRQIIAGGHAFNDLALTAANTGSTIDLGLLLKAYGGSFANNTAVNWLSDKLSIDTELSADTLRLSQLLQAFELEQKGEGLLELNFDGATAFDPRVPDQSLANLVGNLVLEGDGLVVEGLDVDRLVNGLLKSQEMTLTDIGGFALAGPLALLVTKGGNYTGALQGALAGETRIPALLTELKIADQKVNFQDVALATDSNRVAVAGHLNLMDQTYGPIEVQILNESGCELFGTKLKGPLDAPEIAAAELAAASVLNPLLSLAKKSQALVNECKPVYQGKIAHPVKPGNGEQGAVLQEH